MYIIKKNPSASGAYGTLTSWDNKKTVPEGYVLWPDELDTETYYANKGFVTLTINDNNIVTNYEPNNDALQTYEQSQIESLRAAKLNEMSTICQNTIFNGADITLSTGEEHFSFKLEDQTNIDSMFNAVTLGAEKYPYHSDGNQCKMYSASDITTIYVTCKTFVTQQTTYNNFLKAWIERETNYTTLNEIYYGQELPSDLALEMRTILTEAQTEIQAVVEKLKGASVSEETI